MKYAPKKVFVKVDNSYIEISNEQHEQLRITDKQYAQRWFIPVGGYLMETTEEQYRDFYKDSEREKYLRKLSRSNSVLSIEAFDTEDDNGTDFLADDSEDIAEVVATKIMIEKLHTVLPLLSESEQELIDALYFKGYSEREWSKQSGIAPMTIHDRKHKILGKLKKLLEN